MHHAANGLIHRSAQHIYAIKSQSCIKLVKITVLNCLHFLQLSQSQSEHQSNDMMRARN